MTTEPEHATAAGQATGTILVVEDEVLVAMEMEDRLIALGYNVLGPAPSVADANALLDQGLPRAALLDVNLGDETVAPVARRLQEASIPFALVTGYARLALDDPALRDAPRLSKPVADRDLVRMLQRLAP